MNTRQLLGGAALFTLVLMLVVGAGTAASTEIVTGGAGHVPAQVYTDHDAIWIDGNADFLSQAAAEGWSGDGSAENPLTIEGYRITNSSTQCIRLWNVDLHWVIKDCLLEGGPPYVCGLWLSNVSNGKFMNNVIRNRHTAIIGFDGTENVTFAGNEVYNNTAGAFEIQGGMQNCDIVDNVIDDNGGSGIWILGGYLDGQLMHNSVSDGVYGIYVHGGENSSIESNTIQDTSSDGIMMLSAARVEAYDNSLRRVDTGILVTGEHSVIRSNLIDNSTEYGIRVASGHNISIQQNKISNCTGYGLGLSATTANTTVRENAFIDNSASPQVIDDGEDNTFIYNHYNDWISPDANGDNIVDIPYSLDGETNSSDLYPLVDPDEPIPTATSPPTTALPSLIAIETVMIVGVAIVVISGVVLMKLRR
ncbi:MAG: right-handed parallel beta-helix repeat-containing protein [Candidatus Thorarchaeota archaeon]